MYEELSEERKELQAKGKLPDWFTTPGWQMFKKGYLYEADDFKGQAERIANQLSKYRPRRQNKYWFDAYYSLLWRGWLAASTPVLANCGTKRGCSVSCSGVYVPDSIEGFYGSRLECALMTKYGFGTSAFMGDIRPRGAMIATGNKANGPLPEFKAFVQASRDVAQGANTRRGAWAGYLPIDHPDFFEVADYLFNNPDDLNVGWNISDAFIQRLDNGDHEALERYQRAMKIRCVTGKGYLHFIDKVNRQNPQMYKDHNLSVKASNLCMEIELHSDINHSFSCVLSSLNLAKYDEWKNTDAVRIATHFLDCVAEDFIAQGRDLPGLERVLRFTKKSKALGLGALGFHTYLQQKGWAFDSMEAHMWNNQVFSEIKRESLKASQEIAKEFGEPLWCKGYGQAHTHLCVSGDTTLLTKAGYVPIEKLVSKSIEIWNGHEWSLVTPFKTSDNRPLLKVTLSNGVTLKVTEDHRWLVRNNRNAKPVATQTDALEIGDKLDKWECPIIEGTEEFPYAYTSGFFTGDGSCNRPYPNKYPNCSVRKEIRIYADSKKPCAERLAKGIGKVRMQKDGSLRFYIPQGIPEKYTVPGVNNTIASRLEWLAGLFDADGSNNGTVVSINRKFLLDVQEMLSFTGVRADVTFNGRSGGYPSKTDGCYALSISKADFPKMQAMGFNPVRIEVSKANRNAKHYVYVTNIEVTDASETFCLTDPIRGTALFNGVKTMQCAIAPNTSSALICGSVSQGIEPFFENTFTQGSAHGEIIRVNPVLIELLKAKGKYNKKVIEGIAQNNGSVKGLDFLSDHEKSVFATAFEIDQEAILRLASERQRHICQAQSLNLFFDADEKEEYISYIHERAMRDPRIKGLYYLRSKSGVDVTKNTCIACEG